MSRNESLLLEASRLGEAGADARRNGVEADAERCFRNALALTIEAWQSREPGSARLDVLLIAARHALDSGDAEKARELTATASNIDEANTRTDDWDQLRDVTLWLDTWLVASVRRDPPDTAALEALAHRYWKPLFARCRILTLDHHKASDLAQETWRRVLRARNTLKPGGNFPGFLTTVATNLWRDWLRSNRRAGLMAGNQLASLDAQMPQRNGNGTSISLAELLPDLDTLAAKEQQLLMVDVEMALGKLTPQARDVLISRFLSGESCVEIGRRYGKTQQTISAWVRQAIQDLKEHLAEAGCGSNRKGVS